MGGPKAPAVLVFLAAASASALQFPDTAALKKDWKVSARAEGRPTAFHKVSSGDSASLALEWKGGRLLGARYERSKEFESGEFTRMTEDYGAGAAWHEVEPLPQAARKAVPGLEQEWVLKGYGPGRGWLGSGLERGRFFLVFREDPPYAGGGAAEVKEPLRLNRSWVAQLDTSSQWLHVPCRDSGKAAKTKAKGAPLCFSPGDDPRLFVRIAKKAPLSLEVWLEEEGSETLQGIRRAVQTVSDAGQHEYSQDLSQILLGEAQGFLSRLAQRAPGLFNWPSWQLQEMKDGRVPPEKYLPILRSEKEPQDFLPALRLEGKSARLELDLYYRGAYRLKAEEKGGRP
jgi:hypothetical protein